MKSIALSLVTLALYANALADVQIAVKDGFGNNSLFSSNGQLVRIEGEQVPGFIIIDYAKDEFFMVDSKRNEVSKASLGKLDDTNATARLSLSLNDKGGGQKIAGYLTRKFEMVANSERCGAVYASRELLENNDVRAIFEAMRSMQQFSRRLMGGMSGILPVCQRANMQMADAIESSGAPLRVVDKNGKMLSEVLSVDTDKEFGSKHYELPPGMEMVDMSEKMNQAAQQNQQMMESMPDMDALMQQLQEEDGQMTEEMQQQLEQLKQLLQQQQQ